MSWSPVHTGKMGKTPTSPSQRSINIFGNIFLVMPTYEPQSHLIGEGWILGFNTETRLHGDRTTLQPSVPPPWHSYFLRLPLSDCQFSPGPISCWATLLCQAQGWSPVLVSATPPLFLDSEASPCWRMPSCSAAFCPLIDGEMCWLVGKYHFWENICL